MNVEPEGGITESERILSRLANKTFLKLWSYSNLFRDQDGGKELTDFLVICGRDAIIFSDKLCQYPETGNADRDWSRWFKRAIKKSADQILGAERWIRSFPNRIFLDPKCKQQFPFSIDPNKLRFHRIVVANGASNRCREERGGFGSLAIEPLLVGDAHISPQRLFYDRFTCGRILSDESKYVHIFDDISIQFVLTQLDTITDFVGYLEKKESLIRCGRLHFSPSEQDLLSVYLKRINDRGEHDFVTKFPGAPIVVPFGSWENLQNRIEYKNGIEENKISYIWDDIIQELSKHAADGTFITGSDMLLSRIEVAIRIMAKENRVHRRLLARALTDKLLETPIHMVGFRTLLSLDSSDLIYVFVIFPRIQKNQNITHDEYRNDRRTYLECYCKIVANNNRQAKTVLGIATETDIKNPERSFDYVCFKPGVWTNKMASEFNRLQEQTGWYDSKLARAERHEEEYPA